MIVRSVRLSPFASGNSREASEGPVQSAQRDGGQPDPSGPSGDKALVAYVVAGEDAVNDLRPFLRDRLPDYMIPTAIVRVDALPLTPNGKVDRARLPEPDRGSPDTDYVAPRTPTEIVIARIWTNVLQAERIGSLDNFFELGGHSLLATRVIAHLRDELQVDVPLRALFAEPTVAAFAAEVDRVRSLGAHTGAAIQSKPRSAARRK